jgi:hypothetical protein
MDSMNSPKDNKIERLELEIDQLKSLVYGLRGGLEEMATSYLNECPKGYYRYCQGVMKGTKDES